jgi:hypothetical protein
MISIKAPDATQYQRESAKDIACSGSDGATSRARPPGSFAEFAAVPRR